MKSEPRIFLSNGKLLTLPELVSTSKAADILGIKEATLTNYRWRNDTRLPWVKMGKTIRYKLSDIEDYIERNTVCGGNDAK